MEVQSYALRLRQLWRPPRSNCVGGGPPGASLGGFSQPTTRWAASSGENWHFMPRSGARAWPSGGGAVWWVVSAATGLSPQSSAPPPGLGASPAGGTQAALTDVGFGAASQEGMRDLEIRYSSINHGISSQYAEEGDRVSTASPAGWAVGDLSLAWAARLELPGVAPLVQSPAWAAHRYTAWPSYPRVYRLAPLTTHPPAACHRR